MGCHALLQGIFPTQGSNPGLLHCKWIRCHLSHQFWFFSFTTWEVSCQFLLASGFWCEIHVTLFSSYVEDIVSLLLLSRLFSRPLVFRSLTVVYLDVDFFGLILFRIHSTSSICRFMSFARLGEFSAIVSWGLLWPTFSLFFWDFYNASVGVFDVVPDIS